jgi:MFS family permease
MSVLVEAQPGSTSPAARLPAWRWVHVAVAAGAMAATLPGRTQGLGLVTEPLLRDLHLGRLAYGTLNLWATLLGAAFCLPVGSLLDRFGTRPVLTTNLVLLGGVVVLMSFVGGVRVIPALFLLVLLTRGLGQSALSVVSLDLVGRSAGPRPGPAMGVYSFLTALGFMAAFLGIRRVTLADDTAWRGLWADIGLGVLVAAPFAWLLVRPTAVEGKAGPRGRIAVGHTLRQALRSPAFWVFALATSLYGGIQAGIALFNEAVLAERHFDRNVYLSVLGVMPLVGLASNLATGWLAGRLPLGRLLGVAMTVLAADLLTFPLVNTLSEVYLWAGAMSVAGGMVTVLFFTIWAQAFGTAHLGKIQGAAQLLTVLASALGPLLVAGSHEWVGSYAPLFGYVALAAVALAVAAWWVPLPKPAEPKPA